ncbi:MAG: efflux RND transporter permease subunit [Bilophila wadsworthia]
MTRITTQGRLTTPEQFGDVILRTQPDGSILRLKDVATIELGAQSYDFVGKYNGLTPPIGIYLRRRERPCHRRSGQGQDGGTVQRVPVGVASIPYDTTTS